MNKTIKYLVLFLILILIFLILALWFLPLKISKYCVFKADSGNYTLYLDSKLHNLIEEENVKKCNMEINDYQYTAYMTYNTKLDSYYSYWLSFSTTIVFEDQTTTILIDFGQTTFIKYLFIYEI